MSHPNLLSPEAEAVLFRELGPEEVEEFRQWARDNHDYQAELNPVWHPIIRDEWFKLNVARTEEILREAGATDLINCF